ncbi:ead/Ea22-like family protein [Enterobacter intestinihominis]
MSNIDKRALREAAERAESDSWGYDRDEFNEALTPSTVLALLNEIAELEQRHCGTALLEREEMHTKTLGKMLDELEARDKQIADLKEAFSIALSAAGIDVPAAAGKGE